MSHFAELDENNIVLRVVVGNPELTDEEGLVEIGQLLGGKWIQTSYNARIRGKYACIGDSYLPNEDIFIVQKCHAEAVLNVQEVCWDCSNKNHNVRLD